MEKMQGYNWYDRWKLEICPIVRSDGARRLREKDKKQEKHMKTLPDSEKIKLNPNHMVSGNREYAKMLKHKRGHTQGF